MSKRFVIRLTQEQLRALSRTTDDEGDHESRAWNSMRDLAAKRLKEIAAAKKVAKR